MDSFVRDLFVSIKSEALEGLKITLCGGGGIAAIELPKVAREFRRHGASVRFFVTENCLRFVGRESLEWASGQPVTVNPSGFAEHICHDDAVVIMPATADLIGKIAHGICPDGVSTLVQSALGHKVPVILCPTMHGSLAASPMVQENREKLAKVSDVYFVPPRIEEGKEKAPPPDAIVLEVCHIINRRRNFPEQTAPQILVTYGGTRASLDDVRCITNLSSGRLGQMFARQAYRMGMHVTAVEGNVAQPAEAGEFLKLVKVPEYQDMLDYLRSVQPEFYDAVFHLAAVSDYVPAAVRPGKMSGDSEEITFTMVKSRKFIELNNLRGIAFQAGCKLTHGIAEEGVSTAKIFASKNNLNVVLWNQTGVLHGGEHGGIVLVRDQVEFQQFEVSSKEQIARTLVELFLSYRRTNAVV
jgi:phosphopantothenoylcysteine decarboxylase/phosphopantothenate--cysteine ligase